MLDDDDDDDDYEKWPITMLTLKLQIAIHTHTWQMFWYNRTAPYEFSPHTELHCSTVINVICYVGWKKLHCHVIMDEKQ